MSFHQGMTAATECSDNAASIASMARPHRNASRTIFDHAAERKRSKLRDIWQVVGLWLRRRNDRAILRSLSPRDIHDFCPRHTEVEAEMNKPFWRA